jgi:hypothetical protein
VVAEQGPDHGRLLRKLANEYKLLRLGKAMVTEILLCREIANMIRNIARTVVEWHRGATFY